VAQVSEFSFIVIAAGIAAGQITNEALVLATTVGLITIAVSSYLIEHNERIYGFIAPWISWLEPERMHGKHLARKKLSSKVVLFGFHRMGRVILDQIKKMNKSYLIVDFDPHIVGELSELGEPHIYGDAGDDNFLSEISADKADMIISTIPDVVISLSILTYLRSKKYKGIAIVSTHTHAEAAHCYEAGATYVIVPSVLGGERFKEFLKKKKATKTQWKKLAGEHRSV
jgi:hypothetical protein